MIPRNQINPVLLWSAVKLVGSRRPVGKPGETRCVFPGLSIGDRARAVRRGSAQPTVHKFIAPARHRVRRPVPSLSLIGRGKPRSVCASRVPDVDGADYTTAFKNAHGTIFRELLYPWHPWFAHRIAVHEAIGKSNDLVFRCTLTGSDAGRSVEIPAWMFDRSVCAAVRLTAAPYVSAAALSALRNLLRHALGDPSALSSEPVSGVSRTSPDQNRREAHACQQKGIPDQAGERSAGPPAAARPVWRRSRQGHSGCANVAGIAVGDTGNANRSDGAADPGACRREPVRITARGRS